MVKEIQLQVIEAKPADAGTGKARVSETVPNSLSLQEGDVIEIKGKRITAAKVWKSLPQDQDDGVVRIDGLIRKNAAIALNESVTIRKAAMKDAKSIALASIEMNIMRGGHFEKLVKLRLLGAPLVKDDSILLDLMGTTKPFKVFPTEPTGIVNVCESTKLQVIHRRYSDARDMMNEGLTFLRFRYLKDVEKKLGADYTRFRVPELIEHEHEGEVLKEAEKRVNNTNQPITVFVDLWTKRGKIITLEWATVKPDSTVEYIYEPRKFQAIATEEQDKLSTVNRLTYALKDHEQRLDELLQKLERQIEDINEKLKLQKK